eukprot:4068059-Prorocentrum_lima.AAC.1
MTADTEIITDARLTNRYIYPAIHRPEGAVTFDGAVRHDAHCHSARAGFAAVLWACNEDGPQR